jgi:hypothetical protein
LGFPVCVAARLLFSVSAMALNTGIDRYISTLMKQAGIANNKYFTKILIVDIEKSTPGVLILKIWR